MSARLTVVCVHMSVFAFCCTATPPGSTVDGAMPPDAAVSAVDGANLGSRCTETATEISCTYETTSFTALGLQRTVSYQTPLGTPPPGGWPVVFYYQGSLVSAENAWHATHDAVFGQFQLTRTIHALLDGGYAVVAPDTLVDVAWETNIPPFAVAWATSSDNAFLEAIFGGIRDGLLGPIDSSRMYAMGISSGGYMTSRMAVSYPGRFRALVIHSASYATCGAVCFLPPVLPSDHPPTLFVHGAVDPIVPIAQMYLYRNELASEGHVVDTLVSPTAGHEWIADAVPAVGAWFAAHP